MLELLTGRKSYDRLAALLQKIHMFCTYLSLLHNTPNRTLPSLTWIIWSQLKLSSCLKIISRSRLRGEQFLVRWAIPQLHDIDALAKMVDPSLKGLYPIKSLSRFADIISSCVQVRVFWHALYFGALTIYIAFQFNIQCFCSRSQNSGHQYLKLSRNSYKWFREDSWSRRGILVWRVCSVCGFFLVVIMIIFVHIAWNNVTIYGEKYMMYQFSVQFWIYSCSLCLTLLMLICLHRAFLDLICLMTQLVVWWKLNCLMNKPGLPAWNC